MSSFLDIKQTLHYEIAINVLRENFIFYAFLSYGCFPFFSTALRCGIFSEKTLKKKHLCRHDKNYYYFCKSNITVINLIVDSRNMIKVPKNMRLQKIR